jgi:hypothetical protein
MKRRVKVRELMRSEGVSGEIVNGSEGSNCH